MRTKVGAGEVGGNLEEEIKGTHSFNISESVKGRIGKDVNVTTEGDEERINNGFYSLTAKSDIDAFTTGGTIRLNAFGSIFAECTSGIVAVTSGTTLFMQSASTMTLKSESTIDMDATTEVDIDSALINLN